MQALGSYSDHGPWIWWGDGHSLHTAPAGTEELKPSGYKVSKWSCSWQFPGPLHLPIQWLGCPTGCISAVGCQSSPSYSPWGHREGSLTEIRHSWRGKLLVSGPPGPGWFPATVLGTLMPAWEMQLPTCPPGGGGTQSVQVAWGLAASEVPLQLGAGHVGEESSCPVEQHCVWDSHAHAGFWESIPLHTV